MNSLDANMYMYWKLEVNTDFMTVSAGFGSRDSAEGRRRDPPPVVHCGGRWDREPGVAETSRSAYPSRFIAVFIWTLCEIVCWHDGKHADLSVPRWVHFSFSQLFFYLKRNVWCIPVVFILKHFLIDISKSIQKWIKVHANRSKKHLLWFQGFLCVWHTFCTWNSFTLVFKYISKS